MIWVCSICEAHFEGPAPPRNCYSCGSPPEYFTEYCPDSQRSSARPYRPREEATKGRPVYTEVSIRGDSFSRFHSARYFHRQPSDFYKNFLETRRTFRAGQRFAGPGFNSGFYFATTKESAVAELLKYTSLENVRCDSSLDTVLKGLQVAHRDCIFLEVSLKLDKVADLSDPIVLRYFLEHGPARAEIGPTDVPQEYARLITNPRVGGTTHTDGIGYHAYIGGWNAVRFPSVRALQGRWGVNELTKLDILTKVAPSSDASTEPDIPTQLRTQAIIVVFCGSLLTRSIYSYRWTDVTGATKAETNPYFGTDATELEAVRLEFRKRCGMDPVEATELGYLSDKKIEEEFAANVVWVRQREQF